MTGADPGPAPNPHIVVPEFLPSEHLSALRAAAHVVYSPDLYSSRSELLAAVGSAEAIVIRNRTIVDEELLVAAPELRVVGRLGVGLDNIDMEATRRAGVEVIPAVGANAVSVAEYVLGAILVLQRGVYAMSESVVAGEWPRQGHAFGHEVMGKTLGLIGLGTIAREVARRASAFHMRILAHDPYVPAEDDVWSGVERVEFEDLLAEADVISLHVPRHESTTGLIDAVALSRMKPTAIIVNTARGGIVDEAALAAALRRGSLRGAALDVFEVEPLGPESATRFAGLPNVILTPHLAGNTAEAVDRVAAVTVSAVLSRLVSGGPLRR